MDTVALSEKTDHLVDIVLIRWMIRVCEINDLVELGSNLRSQDQIVRKSRAPNLQLKE